MARSTERKSLRQTLTDLKRLRDLRWVKGRWEVRKAFASKRFANAGVEVVGVDNGRSVMALIQGDGSDFRSKDVDYLVQLHNVFPDLIEYVGALEQHVGRQRGALIQVRNFLENEMRIARRDGEKAPVPPVILDRLDTVIRECSAAMAERSIPEYAPTPPDRHRAIRITA